MITCCAITDKGIEKIALLELDEIIKAKGSSEECAVLFECKDYDQLLTFCYKSQSIKRALILFGSFTFKNQEELIAKAGESLKKAKLKEWFGKENIFRVECERIGEHDFGSQTVEEAIGEQVIGQVKQELGFKPKVSMKSPDTKIYVFINNNQAYFGIDLAGRDLSKRNYRIFSAPGIINANLAYALVRMSSYSPEKKQKFVDVFCKSGVVCIEAALYAANLSVNYYAKDFAFKKLKPFAKKDWEAFFKSIDSKARLEKLDIIGSDPLLRNLEASKKNAKLAGIDKLINFSKIDIEWLDTKKDEKSIDVVASRIACPSKHTREADIRKLYKELFYQLEFVVKKKAKLALLTENTSLLKETITKDFKIIKEDEFWAGEQRYMLIILEKV